MPVSSACDGDVYGATGLRSVRDEDAPVAVCETTHVYACTLCCGMAAIQISSRIPHALCAALVPTRFWLQPRHQPDVSLRSPSVDRRLHIVRSFTNRS